MPDQAGLERALEHAGWLTPDARRKVEEAKRKVERCQAEEVRLREQLTQAKAAATIDVRPTGLCNKMPYIL